MSQAKTLNPLTAEQRNAHTVKNKGIAIEVMALQADTLRTHWYQRRELSHQTLQRVLQSMLRLVGFTDMDNEAPERLAQKFRVAAKDGESNVIHVGLDGRIFLTGYYDVRKLHRTMLW